MARGQAGSFGFDMNMDQASFGWADPKKLKEARTRGVEKAGRIWATETKEYVSEIELIDTSLYINSIGYITDYPHTNRSGKGKRYATESDVLYELEEAEDTTTLRIGSDIHYAAHLEKRAHAMAIGLDRAQLQMNRAIDEELQKIML